MSMLKSIISVKRVEKHLTMLVFPSWSEGEEFGYFTGYLEEKLGTKIEAGGQIFVMVNMIDVPRPEVGEWLEYWSPEKVAEVGKEISEKHGI